MQSLARNVTYREILGIALPMVVSQASETVMLFADRIFLSRVSMLAFSAALSGGISNFVFQSFFLGLLGYANALVAQYYGAQRMSSGLRTVSQGIILSVIAYPLSLMLIPLGRLSFDLAGHSPAQIEYEYVYFGILMSASIFSFTRAIFSSFFIGIGRTRIVLIANIIGMCVNIPLNYIFIFGKLGLPAMGIRGAALGTIGGIVLINIILFIAYLHSTEYREHKEPQIWHFDRAICKIFLRFGIPAGVELFLNVSAFNVGLQLLHSYGVGVATAVTITFNYDAIAFIPMLGLGFATTSIVGRYMGAKDPAMARKAGFKSWNLSLIYGLGIVALFVFGAKPLVAVFSSQFGEFEEEYLALAQKMLQLAAVYTLADMTQLVFSSALRGAGDTRWVMRASVLIHWIYAAAAIYFTRVLNLNPLSMWLLFIGVITCLGITMLFRYVQGKWQEISVIDK